MSEDRLERIEARLDDLGRGVDGLRQEMRDLNEGTREETRTLVQGLRGEMSTLAQDLRGEMGTLAQDLRGEMRALNEETNRHMRVLHEEVIDRIAALAPDFAPIRREFRQADTELRESIERRLEPLEAAERSRRPPR